MGAACDNFLTSNQQILNEDQWQTLQSKWEHGGDAVECTTSTAVADFKEEIEKLCSVTDCSYQVEQALRAFFSREERLRTRLSMMR